MSRHTAILDNPELRRAVMTLAEYDGYEIEKAKLELRKSIKFLPLLGGDIMEMAEELERCE